MRIIVTEFMSLDGVMEEPRWTLDFDRGKEGDQFKYEELFDAGSLLLGRVTYQGFAAAWPGMGHDDFGQRMNSIHKYVVSSTLADSDATWGPSTVLRGDVAAEVAAIKDQPAGQHPPGLPGHVADGRTVDEPRGEPGDHQQHGRADDRESQVAQRPPGPANRPGQHRLGPLPGLLGPQP